MGNQDIFAQALSNVLGEWHSAPMVAFGTMKRLSAWKMYCRANDVPFEVANKLGEGLKAYEMDYKHADEDEKKELDVFDYVPKEYHDYLRQSEKYFGMIDSISPHPCAYLICNSDIRREVGIYRINSKTGKKKIVYAAFIDGATADAFGYLKNDNLAVDVVKVNADIYQRIGIPQPTVPQLLSLVDGDQATWDLYRNGFTLGLNQAEKEKSTEKAMRYSPRNISELSAFVAGIRPGFQSMAGKLFGRERFTYGIDALDHMLQTQEMKDSFILYQEQVMMIMQWAGFEPSESYAAIKAIAKKHPEKVLPMKERFLSGFTGRLVSESGLSQSDAADTAQTVWKIVEDNTGYSFNSSHSVAVALDSLYTAWAKAHHPYETYAALLSNYAEKKDKDRIARAKDEMKKAFGIQVVPCKFRQDNRSFFIDKQRKTISDTLTSIKGISAKTAATLYALRDKSYPTAIDLFWDLDVNTSINSAVVETLIRMDYFSEFGSVGKLLALYREYKDGESKFSKSHVAATQQKRLSALREMASSIPESAPSMQEQIAFEIEYLGLPMSVYPESKGCFAVLDVDDKYTPKIKMYNVATGTSGTMKVKKKLYTEKPLAPGTVIDLVGWGRKPARKYQDGKSSIVPGVFDLWINDYKILKL